MRSEPRAPRIGVVTFPGSNDDRDARHAVALAGGAPVALWHADDALGDVDGVILPGGFSYGDYLRCGALARFSPVMRAVRAFADAGGPVLGICNGFQILCESHLLPGALTPNRGRRFICRDADLVVAAASPWLGERPAGATLRIPVKHHDGAWHAPAAECEDLVARGQILLRYADDVNGSHDLVAGVTNEAGNVFGLMPHPEHAVEDRLGGTDGRVVVEALLGAARRHRDRDDAGAERRAS
jgi:phosphoribosylformylglycinamidine synthase